VQIYTWKNATLKELCALIQGVRPSARKKDARISFAFVYPDKHGKNVLRHVRLCMSLYGDVPISPAMTLVAAS
jgi:histone deacetylase complex subunit SAP18